jgi:hypothetical protein
MLGRNGRTPPSASQPPPQPHPDAEIDFNSDDFGDSQFDEWDEAYIADT